MLVYLALLAGTVTASLSPSGSDSTSFFLSTQYYAPIGGAVESLQPETEKENEADKILSPLTRHDFTMNFSDILPPELRCFARVCNLDFVSVNIHDNGCLHPPFLIPEDEDKKWKARLLALSLAAKNANNNFSSTPRGDLESFLQKLAEENEDDSDDEDDDDGHGLMLSTASYFRSISSDTATLSNLICIGNASTFQSEKATYSHRPAQILSQCCDSVKTNNRNRNKEKKWRFESQNQVTC